MCNECQRRQQQKDDSVKWLALLIRQGLKVVVVGIERKYGLREVTQSEEREQQRKTA